MKRLKQARGKLLYPLLTLATVVICLVGYQNCVNKNGASSTSSNSSPSNATRTIATAAPAITQCVDPTQSPYFADPTGKVDSTKALQAALNAVGIDGCVKMPPGLFYIENLTLPAAVRFEGSGVFQTTLLAESSGKGILITDQGLAEKIFLGNMTISANKGEGYTAIVQLGFNTPDGQNGQFGTYGMLWNLYLRDGPDATALRANANVGLFNNISSTGTENGIYLVGNGNFISQISVLGATGFSIATTEASWDQVEIEAPAQGSIPIELLGTTDSGIYPRFRDLIISLPAGTSFPYLVQVPNNSIGGYAFDGVVIYDRSGTASYKTFFSANTQTYAAHTSMMSEFDATAASFGTYAAAVAPPADSVIVGGRLGVGTPTPAYPLDVDGSANLAANGALSFGGTTVCRASGCLSTSDERLKENIQPLENSLNQISRLHGVSFTWKNQVKFGTGPQIGLVAQELEKVYPEAVVMDPKSGIKSIAYDHLAAPLIEALKEADAKVDKLEAENLEMKARLDKIEKKLK